MNLGFIGTGKISSSVINGRLNKEKVFYASGNKDFPKINIVVLQR